MNSKIKGIIFFTIGCAAGIIIANGCLKNRYEQIMRDEIDSVENYYKSIGNDSKKSSDVEEVVNECKKQFETAYASYQKIVDGMGYISDEEESENSNIEYLDPRDFGTIDDYERISLSFYEEDSILADDQKGAMTTDEIRDTVGLDFTNHFGEYEEDSVFVRNNRLKADYEILLIEGRYSDELRDHPYLAR